jgi:protein phosphatase PTC7
VGVDTGICFLPHPEKAEKGGEDAYFVSSNQRFWGRDNTPHCAAARLSSWGHVCLNVTQNIMANALSMLAGVADGVGSWSDVGVDAGEYSRLLMAEAKLLAEETQPSQLAPRLILKAAHQRTTVRGSSTACILALEGDHLHSANLGDSGFLIVRNGEVVFQSPQQQHHFNFPYQLGYSGSVQDSPDRAQVR